LQDAPLESAPASGAESVVPAPESGVNADPAATFQAVKDKLDPARSREVMLEKMAIRARVYDALIASERPDEAWTSAVTERMTTTLGALLGGGKIDVASVTCTTTLCRVELRYPTEEVGERMLQVAPSARTLLGAPAMLRPTGERSQALYFSREGQELPEVPSSASRG
jgi:hypothetical protein